MKLFSASIPPEAHIVCELLKTQGIQCEVRGEGLFGLQGELPFGENSEPYVWLLNKSQQQQSLSLIQQYMDSTSNGQTPWLCKQCGASVEPQFSCCWNCGAQDC